MKRSDGVEGLEFVYTGSYVLRTLVTHKAARFLALILSGMLLMFVLLLFLPWQQNVRGTGQITALNPANRPQTVETVIAGRIQQWFVREGDSVSKGDTIVSISEIKEKYFDPDLLKRLGDQIAAKENSLDSKMKKVEALRRQLNALQDAMKLKIQQSVAKVEAERIKFQNAENQFQRNKKLYDAGNITLTKFQEVEYKFQGSQAEFLSAQIEVERTEAEYRDKIGKTESDLSNTRAEVFDTEAEIIKSRNEYANTEIRNSQYQIIAPQDGYIIKAIKAGIGETIKEGEAVCTIMPEVSDMAVEMHVKAVDIPLVSKGRKVRVQFDGWPALQFAGWPSVSVGTFGGEVKVIDYVTSKPGEFRILVVPDAKDEAWPRLLRIGSGTKGWVMLDSVPVWYELWRQLNGFPASLYDEPMRIEAQNKKKDGK